LLNLRVALNNNRNLRLKSMFNPIVVCADIGSVAKGNFAWWSSSEESGLTPSSLAKHVSSTLNASKAVALGFECPLYVPLAENELELTNARQGESSRAWSASAGSTVLATGLVQVAWVLREIRNTPLVKNVAYLDWSEFSVMGAGLFIWEAFVSGHAKRGDATQNPHIADAKYAVETFQQALPEPTAANALAPSLEVYSLIGAALLRTGWSEDYKILKQPCLVIKAA
jgi:hypothetical protein